MSCLDAEADLSKPQLKQTVDRTEGEGRGGVEYLQLASKTICSMEGWVGGGERTLKNTAKTNC